MFTCAAFNLMRALFLLRARAGQPTADAVHERGKARLGAVSRPG
ncbi:MAG: hypothetical protein ACPL2E_05765 [Conexivisphaera sp.]